MTLYPQLRALARHSSHDPEQALVTVLGLACELLGMDRAGVGVISSGLFTIEVAVDADGTRSPRHEKTRALTRSFAHLVGPSATLIVADTSSHLDSTDAADAHRDVRSYVGTSLATGRDGGRGVLGVAGLHPLEGPDGWRREVLEGLAPAIDDLWSAMRRDGAPAADETAGRPGPAAVETPGAGSSLSAMARPLLEALQELSGLATTFLARVDEESDRHTVVLTHHTRAALQFPEGTQTRWSESACHLSVEEDAPAVNDVPTRWPQVQVAVELGLTTHVTVPVRLSDGRLWGTLCASDVTAHDRPEQHLPTMRLFARLIANEIDRELTLVVEREAARAIARRSQVDELTGASTRGTVEPWISTAIEGLSPDDVVVVAFVDVDRFKAVNDAHGHPAGDAVLVELVTRLRHRARHDDLVARMGGDELLLGAILRREALPAFQRRLLEACSFELERPGGAVAVTCSLGFATSDETSGPALVETADVHMYRHKAVHRR